MITSASNARLKLVRALMGRPRERREAQAFVAEGVRLLEEALKSDWPFRFVLHGQQVSERGRRLLKDLRDRGVETDEVADGLFAKLSETEASQGILGVLTDEGPRASRPMQYVLITDGVRDPGNLGTLIRTAEAAGFDAVFLAPGTVDAYSPKVVRSGMGAHFRLPLYEVHWTEISTQAKTYGWNAYLADMAGQACWDLQFKPPLALIVGGEAEGASAEARQAATQTVAIPMQGKVESLNAAVAGAVLMFEVARQRGG